MAEPATSTGQSKSLVGTDVFLLLSSAGSNRDLSKGSREQAFWDQHAEFIDGLVEDGFIILGGPLNDEGGAVLIVRADTEDDVRETMNNDPWYREGILKRESIKRWTIFIDDRD